jgi:hypothetical protein
MSDDNHIDEKRAIQQKGRRKTRVQDCTIEGTREPLEPMEAMVFAQEYIQSLNEK